MCYLSFLLDDLSYNKTASQSRRVAWPFSDVSNAKNAVNRKKCIIVYEGKIYRTQLSKQDFMVESGSWWWSVQHLQR